MAVSGLLMAGCGQAASPAFRPAGVATPEQTATAPTAAARRAGA